MDRRDEVTDEVTAAVSCVPGRPRSVEPRSDDGITLIEIVITISLLGLVVLGLLASIQTSIIASSTAYDGSQIETVLLNAADRVSRAPQLCDYEDYADAAALAEGWSVSTVSVQTEKLIANTGNPASDWGTQPCPADVGAFDVQRVLVTATTPDGGITRRMTVVKSSVD
jgi:Tfp pilus assembly protein PilV